MPLQKLYTAIRAAILPKLENELAPDLLYHSVNHTIDVETQAERIAIAEGINDIAELFLLRLACLYHDSGFLFVYKEHEAEGCRLARKELPDFGLNLQQIEIICGMIMATRIPQTPRTHLEKIICDADLDYLGREDFLPISKNLFLEWKAKEIISSDAEWYQVQYNFFKMHQYFTKTEKLLRGPQKQKDFEVIEAYLQN